MKRLISSLLVIATLATAVPAWASDEVPVEEFPVIAPLKKGQVAPFPGVLFSTEAVAKVIAEKEELEKSKDLAVKRQLDVDEAKLKFKIDQLTSTCTADKSILQAQVDDQKNQIKILNEQLKSSSSGPGTPVWLGLGAVGGAVVTVLIVFGVSQAQK